MVYSLGGTMTGRTELLNDGTTKAMAGYIVDCPQTITAMKRGLYWAFKNWWDLDQYAGVDGFYQSNIGIILVKAQHVHVMP